MAPHSSIVNQPTPTHRTGHADYSANCSAIAAQHGRVGGQAVQVLRKGAVLCGHVRELSVFSKGNEREWFRVETCIGTGWVPATNVRLCEGVDDRCTCRGEE